MDVKYIDRSEVSARMCDMYGTDKMAVARGRAKGYSEQWGQNDSAGGYRSVDADDDRLRVAAYCRVSTDSDEQESSYEAQCRHYSDYIRGNDEWIMAGIYADEGITGTNTKRREEFKRMIADCADGRIDMILTKSISRFARNTLDCLRYIRKLKHYGVAVYFEKENINTLDSKGEVLITIMASIAQQESQSISLNTQMGIRYRMQQGIGRLNTSSFMGLARGERPGELVVEKDGARVVRRIFREYLDGYSPQMICRHLMNEGVAAPGGGQNWHPSTIVSMLRNEKYMGDLLMQKYYTEDFLEHRIVRNTGALPQYLIEDHHEAIVPRKVFAQVQNEMERRRKLAPEPSKLRCSSETDFLRGRLVCGCCRRMLKRCRVIVDEGQSEFGGEEPAHEIVVWCCVKRSRVFKAKLHAGAVEVRGGSESAICDGLSISNGKSVYPDMNMGCVHITDEDAKAAIVYALNHVYEYEEQIRTEMSGMLESRDPDCEVMMRRNLLELIEELGGPGTYDRMNASNSAYPESDQTETWQSDAGRLDVRLGDGGCCSSYEDFMQRTRYRLPSDVLRSCRDGDRLPADILRSCRDGDRLPGDVLRPGKRGTMMHRYNDAVAARYVDRVVAHADNVCVELKAGVGITVPKGISL